MRLFLIVLSASQLLISNIVVAEDKIRTHGGIIGDPPFLEAGDWWNLFGSEDDDPIKRSIRAVKILHVSKQHPGWVQIAYPKSRDKHSSIFGPAARAHDDDSINKREALAEWEKSVSEWKVIWVNLDYVVSASPVAKNPSAEEEVIRAKEAKEEVYKLKEDFLDWSSFDLRSSLDGRWEQTAYIPSESSVEEADWYWEFDLSEGRYRVFNSLTSQAAANAGTMKVDLDARPARITLSPLIANGPTHGIFKIEGEVLVIALAEDVPSDFKPSDGKHIYQFKRRKKLD